jgi:hypothetical protein
MYRYLRRLFQKLKTTTIDRCDFQNSRLTHMNRPLRQPVHNLYLPQIDHAFYNVNPAIKLNMAIMITGIVLGSAPVTEADDVSEVDVSGTGMDPTCGRPEASVSMMAGFSVKKLNGRMEK